MKKLKQILMFAVATATLASCSIDKRVHMKGYHVNWNNSKVKEIKTTDVQNTDNYEVTSIESTENKLTIENEYNKSESASLKLNQPLIVKNETKEIVKNALSKTASEASNLNKVVDIADLDKKEIKKLRKTFLKEHKKSSPKGTKGLEPWVYVLLILLVPFGTTISMYFYEDGWTKRVTVNLILTLLCGLPGLIHALVVIFGNK